MLKYGQLAAPLASKHKLQQIVTRIHNPIQTANPPSPRFFPAPTPFRRLNSPGFSTMGTNYDHDERYILVFFCSPDLLEQCASAVGEAGAGSFSGGKYTDCAFSNLGNGRFRAGSTARPYIGTAGEMNRIKEARVECICVGKEVVKKAVEALKAAHEYDVPVYYVHRIENF